MERMEKREGERGDKDNLIKVKRKRKKTSKSRMETTGEEGKTIIL